jgi:hypothetical protein
LNDWNENLRNTLLSNLWPLNTIPTLLYTWQYYDMVERAASPNGKRLGFWPRTVIITIVIISTLLITGMHSYCNALSIWYLEPEPDYEHFNIKLAKHYKKLTNWTYNF